MSLRLIVPLSEVVGVRGLVGGPFGSSLVQNDYELAGVPVIRGTNLGFGREIGGDFVFVSDEKTDSDLARNTAVPGDLVFTQRGTLGQVALVPDAGIERYVVSQSQMRLRADPSIASTNYLYYACSSDAFLKQIDDNAISTGVPHINLGILSRLTVPLPRLSTQQAIAEVLGALDDKIAANTKLAATADEFLSAHLSALLDSDYEEIRLGDVAEVNAETVKPILGSSLRYIDIASVGVGSHDFPELTSWDEAPSRARRRVRKGDTIWSTVRPNRRSHSLNLSEDPLLVGSTGLAVLSPTKVGLAYLYEVTKTPNFTAYLENVAEGSAYPAVRADRFTEAPIPLLAQSDREEFEALATPIREHIHSLSVENQTLAATRDALLPQLMSGKLRVKDADMLVPASL